jgi:hypothetical protein
MFFHSRFQAAVAASSRAFPIQRNSDVAQQPREKILLYDYRQVKTKLKKL